MPPCRVQDPTPLPQGPNHPRRPILAVRSHGFPRPGAATRTRHWPNQAGGRAGRQRSEAGKARHRRPKITRRPHKPLHLPLPPSLPSAAPAFCAACATRSTPHPPPSSPRLRRPTTSPPCHRHRQRRGFVLLPGRRRENWAPRAAGGGGEARCLSKSFAAAGRAPDSGEDRVAGGVLREAVAELAGAVARPSFVAALGGASAAGRAVDAADLIRPSLPASGRSALPARSRQVPLRRLLRGPWSMGWKVASGGKTAAGGEKQLRFPGSSAAARSRMKLWVVRATTTVLLWTCVVQLTAVGDTWGPRVLKGWPSCLTAPEEDPVHGAAAARPLPVVDKATLPPKRIYRNNGYLMVSCNGGLNQMRAAICDMVVIARYLNVTLVVPELDKTSFWNDPSEFQDIFDVEHFITSLRGEVRILRELPPRVKRRVELGMLHSMPPVSWSDISYYQNQILPLIRKYKVLHLNRTDARLANNGLPTEIQKLRCRVNYASLRFTPQIEELGKRVIRILRQNGPFLVLHLRYEMDMLAFSGCTQGCSSGEAEELTRMRYAYPWWKEKVIDSDLKRKDGLCPLTPEETALVLSALDIDRSMQIYIAAGEIYGGKRRMAALTSAYPNVVRKETLLEPSDLMFFQNHSSQMAALDYLVSLESDIFVPTYDGNMAKVVEGHRRFMGFKKTVLLDRKLIVELVDRYTNGSLRWDEFSSLIKAAHSKRMGSATKRMVIPDRPKEEDYFYANPQECLQGHDLLQTS